MRPRKVDWENLREAMPGTIITVPPPPNRKALYSIVSHGNDEWSLVRGTVARRTPEVVTERIEVTRRADALTISRELLDLDATLPLPEQETGETDLPSPRDLYWNWCVEQLPGEYLITHDYERRIAYSLKYLYGHGWQVHFIDEVEEDRLDFGDYLDAFELEEEPEIRVLKRSSYGVRIGNRSGVIPGDEIRDVLRGLGVDLRTVAALPWEDDEDEDEEDEDENDEEEEEDEGTVDGARRLPVEVISVETPLRERIAGRRWGR